MKSYLCIRLYFFPQPGLANNHEDPSKHVGESLKSSLVLFSTDDQRMKTEVNSPQRFMYSTVNKLLPYQFR